MSAGCGQTWVREGITDPVREQTAPVPCPQTKGTLLHDTLGDASIQTSQFLPLHLRWVELVSRFMGCQTYVFLPQFSGHLLESPVHPAPIRPG